MDPRIGTTSPEELLAHASFLQRLSRELVADAHAAADLAQDTWVAALERPPQREGSLRGWLATVAANLARNAGRSAGRRRDREARVARADLVDGEGLPLERLEIQRALFDLLIGLPEEQRTVLYLRYYEGLTPSAIAARLAVPLKTVKTRHTRAIAALRERLDARSGGDRRQWLEALAPLAIPVASGSALGPVFGGLVVKKLALVGVAVLLAAFAWWTIGRGELEPQPVAGPARAVADLAQPAAPRAEVAAVLAPAAEPAQRASLASIERATTGALDVHLSWSDGTPAAGVGIDVRCSADPAPRVELARGVTDAQGFVHFADLHAGSAWLRPDMRKRFAAEVEAGTTRSVAYTIPAGVEVVGRVVDPLGGAVGGATIWCRGEEFQCPDMRLALACAADGTFRLRDVSRSAEIGARAGGHGPSPCVRVKDVPLDAGGVRPVELRLGTAGGRVRGRVLDPDGAPIARARVQAGPGGTVRVHLPPGILATTAPPGTVESADDGTFEIVDDLEPGLQPVHATARGFPVWSGEVLVSLGAVATIDIRLERAARVEGRLLGIDGAPAAGIEVVAAHEEDGGYSWTPFPPSRATTDAQGRFALDWLAPGPCELNAHSEVRPEIGRAQANVECVAGATTAVELRLGRGLTIAGRVVDENGAPLAGWRVRADDAVGHWHDREATTSADGSFAVLNLTESTFDLSASAPDDGTTRAHLPAVVSGTSDVVIVVADAHAGSGSVRGRMIDAGGAALEDVEITLWAVGKNEGFYLPFDARSGAFEHDAQPGRYYLTFARGARTLLTSPEFAVAEGDSTDVGELVLPQLGQVEIVLKGLPPDAPEGLLLSLERRYGSQSTERLTELYGVWHSAEIQPGPWRVHLHEGRLCLRGAEIEVRAGGTTRVELPVEPALPIQVSFANPDRGAFVVEVRDANRSLLRLTRYAAGAVTDPVLIGIGLPIGRARVEVRTDSGWSGAVEIDVSAATPAAPAAEVVLRRER